MVNHEIKWNNDTVFSVKGTEENKHQHHHCSTENKISSPSFPPFQEDGTQMKSYTTYFTELRICINKMQTGGDGNGMLQLADFSTLDKQNQTRAIAWCQEWAQ